MIGSPRTVLWDLETVPDLQAALRAWPQLSNYPGITLKANLSSIIVAGYKVLGEPDVHAFCAWDYSGWKTDVNDDREICEAIATVIRGADQVVTHNGKRFDWKHLQTRMRKHKMEPLPRIPHIDTCAELKREYFLHSNSLKNSSRFLTDEEKMDHEGWDLWVKVHGRDVVAQETMKQYCMQDVRALEALYYELRPTARGGLNHNLFMPAGSMVCPKCGSTRLQSRGKAYTKTRSSQRYVCIDCGGWSQTDSHDELLR